jgi:hypothetical protein
LDVVDQLDLAPFLRAYRADGHGHLAYDPKILLGGFSGLSCGACILEPRRPRDC